MLPELRCENRQGGRIMIGIIIAFIVGFTATHVYIKYFKGDK